MNNEISAKDTAVGISLQANVVPRHPTNVQMGHIGTDRDRVGMIVVEV